MARYVPTPSAVHASTSRFSNSKKSKNWELRLPLIVIIIPNYHCLIEDNLQSSIFNLLDVNVTSETEHAVGAGEGVVTGRNDDVHALNLLLGRVHVVVGVVRLEVSSLHHHVVCNPEVETETEAVAVDHKRHIVHVGIGEVVARQLTTSRDRQTRNDVPLCTSQILIGTAAEQLLAVLIPVGLCVEEVVVAQIGTHIFDDAPLCTEGQQSR